MSEIPISEIFYSLQGEGPWAGWPAVFLRRAKCNLMCGGDHNKDIENQEDMYTGEDAEWHCDSIETFQNPSFRGTPEEVVQRITDHGWKELLSERAHLVVTGGEPTLPDGTTEIAAIIKKLDYPFTEVETNGTIVPPIELRLQVDQFNVSIKLSNSGMSEERRINPEAINFHSDAEESDFKFVVSRDEDMPEILDLIDRFDINDEDVWLMPSGYSKDDLEKTAPAVAELVKEYGFKYSPRIHVDVWNQAVGV